MARTLKYENLAKIGDRIKAYDFEPMRGRGECFIEGIVQGIIDRPYKAYKILCYRDVWDGNYTEHRVGDVFYVPFESSFEWDDRVTLIN